jgi:23S rRNA (pseudouridine1915-N3)-methyltransferase
MEVAVVAVGRLKAGPERELCARYMERAAKAGRRLGLAGFAVTELAEARAGRAADRSKAEAAAIRAALGPSGRLVCLDEAGEGMTSEDFAAFLRRCADEGQARLAFAIGGPDGLDRGLVAAGPALSLGRMTWPHQLARILLAEQLYRATTILSGHPYHRA